MDIDVLYDNSDIENSNDNNMKQHDEDILIVFFIGIFIMFVLFC